MTTEILVEPVSYDLAALLLRLAIGLALLPFPIKKILTQDTAAKNFPGVLFFSPEAGFYAALAIELSASICMIFGLFTRIMAIPAIVNMGIASKVSGGKYYTSPAQAFFLGFIAILITGPGKYSLDWLMF